jgi:hypothetical protein
MNSAGNDRESEESNAAPAAVHQARGGIHIKDAFVLAGCAAAAVAMAGTISLFLSRSAIATPAYAKQTGKSCAVCHVNPDGGALTPFGEKFKADGHKLPADSPK